MINYNKNYEDDYMHPGREEEEIFIDNLEVENGVKTIPLRSFRESLTFRQRFNLLSIKQQLVIKNRMFLKAWIRCHGK
jgi:hypothetical protein